MSTAAKIRPCRSLRITLPPPPTHHYCPHCLRSGPRITLHLSPEFLFRDSGQCGDALDEARVIYRVLLRKLGATHVEMVEQLHVRNDPDAARLTRGEDRPPGRSSQQVNMPVAAKHEVIDRHPELRKRLS